MDEPSAIEVNGGSKVRVDGSNEIEIVRIEKPNG